ncbi:hypothetical protein DSO57_1027713 [Entomophthora muscae]|uniref:Uncharacterized protein n=1 Tax=Entomophthora muscae TaxID=34485 RepID=A0ACC2T1Y7_9FUNG|nr:hypothetical protein DSO57_1027713 [Entomophthora muscae]
MKLFFALLFGVHGQETPCLGTSTLESLEAIVNIFTICTNYAGSIQVGETWDVSIESGKLESISGQLIVHGELPSAFRKLKVGALLLQNVKVYVQRSYSDLQAGELIINGFTPESQVLFTNLNATSVTIQDSSMKGIAGIVSSRLAKLALRNNPNLENFIMHELTQVTDAEFNQNIKLNLSNAFPKLNQAGNVIITNSGEHDISLPLQVIHDLKVKSNRFALLSLPHLASVHDLSVSENAISTLSLPRLERANDIEIKENQQFKHLDLSKLTDVVNIQVLDKKIEILSLNANLKWESAKFDSPSFGRQYFRQFSGKNNLELHVPSVCFGNVTFNDTNKDAVGACPTIYADVVVDSQSPNIDLITTDIWGHLTFNGDVSGLKFLNLKSVHGTLKLYKTASLKSTLPKIAKVTSLELLNATSFDLKKLQIAEDVTVGSTLLQTLLLETRNFVSLRVENNTNLRQLLIPNADHFQDISFRANNLLVVDFFQVLKLKGSLSVERSGAASVVLGASSIEKDILIQDNENTTFANFPYLETIGGHLSIQNNKLLNTVDFHKVERVTKVTFKDNPELSKFKTATETYHEPDPGSPLKPQPDDPIPDHPKSSHALYYLVIGIPVLLIIGGAIYYFVFHRR